MGLWIPEAVEHFKQGLMGCPSNRLKDSIAESNMDPAQEVSERQNINNLLREHSCDILTKNVARFFFFLPLS